MEVWKEEEEEGDEEEKEGSRRKFNRDVVCFAILIDFWSS